MVGILALAMLLRTVILLLESLTALILALLLAWLTAPRGLLRYCRRRVRRELSLWLEDLPEILGKALKTQKEET